MQITTNETIDYLVLGQTVPEKSKKYGVRVCTAGISLKTFELERVYPLLVNHHFKRWQHFKELPVARNNKDRRDESWKLSIHPSKINSVNSDIVKKSRRKDIIEYSYNTCGYKSIADLNNDRKSLAIIKMIKPRGFFTDGEKKPTCVRQLSLFDDGIDENEVTKKGYRYLPRIEFKTEDGKNHNFQMNSWDAYMHQKNLAPKYGYENLWKANNLRDGQYALIGNLNNYRNTWLIISIF